MPPKKAKAKWKQKDPYDGDISKAWQHSDAKAALYAAIMDGEVPLEPRKNETEDDLWEYFCCRGEIHNYGGFKEHFKDRLAALREQITKAQKRAEEDTKAYEIFKKNHPKCTVSAKGNCPEWEGSEAQKQLLKDMESNLHNQYFPEQLWLDDAPERQCCQLFPLQVFRDHICQNLRTKRHLKQLEGDPEKYGNKWKNFRNNES